MPQAWIPRTLEPVLDSPAEELRLFPVWLLLGPRQLGKSSLLHRCSKGHAFVNLDDLDVRARANRDPVLFMRELRPPFVIDEIQYAPELLSPIKRMVDEGALEPGAIRLTGSQNFRVMRGSRKHSPGGSRFSTSRGSRRKKRGSWTRWRPVSTSPDCLKPDSRA